jgi:exodeoxyribonuclease VII small subunit
VNQDSNPQTEESINFETAFARLEQILEQINKASITLDESIQLYEEANRLITICNNKLNEAEQKIEIVRNRNGEVSIENLGNFKADH